MEASVSVQRDSKLQTELHQLKVTFDESRSHYSGNDPLEIWYNYIWQVDECHRRNSSRYNLLSLLDECLSQFENDVRYINDTRMCKLLIKHIDFQENPVECYRQLHAKGICITCAGFYRAWAFYHELAGDYINANDIFLLGIMALAQPYEELVIAQRDMYTRAGMMRIHGVIERVFLEERHALTSLCLYSDKFYNLYGRTIGQNLSSSSNAIQNVIMSGVENALRHHQRHPPEENIAQPCNVQVPTLCSMCNCRKQNSCATEKVEENPSNVPEEEVARNNITVSKSAPGQPAKETLRLYPDFVSSNLDDFSNWSTDRFYPEPHNPNSIPMYPKHLVYPNNENQEYSLEEIRAKRYLLQKQVPNNCEQFRNELHVPQNVQDLHMSSEIEQAVQSIIPNVEHTLENSLHHTDCGLPHNESQNVSKFLGFIPVHNSPQPQHRLSTNGDACNNFIRYSYSQLSSAESINDNNQTKYTEWVDGNIQEGSKEIPSGHVSVYHEENSTINDINDLWKDTIEQDSSRVDIPKPTVVQKFQIHEDTRLLKDDITMKPDAPNESFHSKIPFTILNPEVDNLTVENATRDFRLSEFKSSPLNKNTHSGIQDADNISTSNKSVEYSPLVTRQTVYQSPEAKLQNNLSYMEGHNSPNMNHQRFRRHSTNRRENVDDVLENIVVNNKNLECPIQVERKSVYNSSLEAAMQNNVTYIEHVSPNINQQRFYRPAPNARENVRAYASQPVPEMKHNSPRMSRHVSQPCEDFLWPIEPKKPAMEHTAFNETCNTEMFNFNMNPVKASTPFNYKKSVAQQFADEISNKNEKTDDSLKSSRLKLNVENYTHDGEAMTEKSFVPPDQNASSRKLSVILETTKEYCSSKDNSPVDLIISQGQRTNLQKSNQQMHLLDNNSSTHLSFKSTSQPAPPQERHNLKSSSQPLPLQEHHHFNTSYQPIPQERHNLKPSSQTLPQENHSFNSSQIAQEQYSFNSSSQSLRQDQQSFNVSSQNLQEQCNFKSSSQPLPQELNSKVARTHCSEPTIKLQEPSSKNRDSMFYDGSNDSNSVKDHWGSSPAKGSRMDVDIANCISQNSNSEYKMDCDSCPEPPEKIDETILQKTPSDPFTKKLIKALLNKIGFPNKNTQNFISVQNIPRLTRREIVTLGDERYLIGNMLGKGTYGSVIKATKLSTNEIVAFKYQKPANHWECYICNEIQNRITNPFLLKAFMSIQYGYYSPTASLLISDFCKYGSLLDILNKVKQVTGKGMKELMVIYFANEIVTIINALHQCQIIHADIKPDNFLVTRIPPELGHPCLQLIDFGCSIDMSLFPKDTRFTKVINTENFICTEMKDGRPWTYQTDLFCVAATVHALLFEKYMQVQKRGDVWSIGNRIPRYMRADLWNTFFFQFLNIEGCDKLPDLMTIKKSFETILSENNEELQVEMRCFANSINGR